MATTMKANGRGPISDTQVASPAVPAEVRRLLDAGAHFYHSMSGGKDSLASYALLCQTVPSDRITVIHANLGEVEWPGIIEHIKANISHPLTVVSAIFKDGSPKTFLEMVRRRHEKYPDKPCWPSPQYRTCTSDLKVAPIDKFIKADMKRRGIKLAVNVMGIRAEESTDRADKEPWALNKRFTTKTLGREVYDWLPIHDWPEARVFSYAAEQGMVQHHAYADGNERLSCAFCIMGCPGDLQNAARQNPELLAKYIDMEQQTGYTMFASGPLAEKLAGNLGSKPAPDRRPSQFEQGELFT